MNYRKLFFGLVMSFVIIAMLLAVTERRTHAAGDTEAGIIERLDRIEGNQKTILSELAAIKQELYIIKIRITQNQ